MQFSDPSDRRSYAALVRSGIRASAASSSSSYASGNVFRKLVSSAAAACAFGVLWPIGGRGTEAAEHSVQQPEPETFLWGRGAFFSLPDRSTPQTLSEVSKWKGLQKIVLRETAGVGAAVTKDNRVIMWAGSQSTSDKSPISSPPVVEMKIRDVVDVVCSRSGRFLSLNKWGQVHTWTKSEPQPKPLPGLPRDKITQIAAGAEHFGLLTASGAVLMFGTNVHGQLGVGSNERNLATPTPIVDLKNRKVKKIALGDHHSVLLDSEGRVLTFGANYFCQLGQRKDPWEHDGLGSTNTPSSVPFLKKRPVRDIACGQDFTIAVTQSGDVMSWGFGRWGQLADGQMRHMKTPPSTAATKPFVNGGAKHIRQVTCGDHHCLALMDGGAVWSWGLNSSGQLGLGSLMPRADPQLITGLVDRKIQSVACGETTSAAME